MLVVGNVYPCNTGHALTPDSLITGYFSRPNAVQMRAKKNRKLYLEKPKTAT
jgi:hypothetical protein